MLALECFVNVKFTSQHGLSLAVVCFSSKVSFVLGKAEIAKEILIYKVLQRFLRLSQRLVFNTLLPL